MNTNQLRIHEYLMLVSFDLITAAIHQRSSLQAFLKYKCEMQMCDLCYSPFHLSDKERATAIIAALPTINRLVVKYLVRFLQVWVGKRSFDGTS